MTVIFQTFIQTGPRARQLGVKNTALITRKFRYQVKIFHVKSRFSSSFISSSLNVHCIHVFRFYLCIGAIVFFLACTDNELGKQQYELIISYECSFRCSSF